MPVAQIRGTTLAYEVVGDGPALLVCHGGPGWSHHIYRSLDPLASGRRLVYWDHRGHGLSGRPPRTTLTMSDWADDAVALAHHLGIERAAVLGHSYGGWVAQEVALRHPDFVSALVLVATTPGQLGDTESTDDDQGPPPPAEVAAALGSTPTSNEELVGLYRTLAPWFARTADPDLLMAHADPNLVDAATMVAVFEALGRWSAVDHLAAVAAPALVVAGRHDVFCSPPQLVRIARRLTRVDHVVFDSGHFPWFEAPATFFGLVDAWLRERGGC